jgi:YcxB-like protein
VANEVTGNGASVSIEYELSRPEVISAVRWHLLHVSHIRRNSLWGLGPVIGGAIFLSIGGSTNNVIGWVGISFGFISFVFWGLLYYAFAGRSGSAMAANGPKALEMNGEGVRIHTRDSDITHRWSAYSEIIEIDEMFLLRLGKRNTYTFVPKRAFRSSSDELKFRVLTEQHIASRNGGV